MANILTRVFGSRNQRLLRQYGKTVKKINALEESVQALDDAGLRGKTEEFKGRVADGESLEQLPQLMAAALMDVSSKSPGWREAKRLAGRRFAQATELSDAILEAILTAGDSSAGRKLLDAFEIDRFEKTSFEELDRVEGALLARLDIEEAAPKQKIQVQRLGEKVGQYGNNGAAWPYDLAVYPQARWSTIPFKVGPTTNMVFREGDDFAVKWNDEMNGAKALKNFFQSAHD